MNPPTQDECVAVMAIAFVGDTEWLDLDAAKRTEACRRMNLAYEAFKKMVEAWDPDAAEPVPQDVPSPDDRPVETAVLEKDIEHA
jgi:transglutaminase-like putative cysteine protease